MTSYGIIKSRDYKAGDYETYSTFLDNIYYTRVSILNKQNKNT